MAASHSTIIPYHTSTTAPCQANPGPLFGARPEMLLHIAADGALLGELLPDGARLLERAAQLLRRAANLALGGKLLADGARGVKGRRVAGRVVLLYPRRHEVSQSCRVCVCLRKEGQEEEEER